MAASRKIVLRKQQLRNNEYYNVQEIQDMFYRQSKENYVFQDLISKIVDKRNILVAYRNIKRNAGSKTLGVDDYSIEDVEKYELSKWVSYIRQRFEDFTPMPIRRVEIEKDDGRKRPLGIPTIEDRMVQQCIKQIMKLIVEAKFYHGSYGFRTDRGRKCYSKSISSSKH
jgi:RNA-directed DNA polymerase